jgi:hypothetical protein
MTVQDIYEQAIKPMAKNDRAALADLILDDLEPDAPDCVSSEHELVQMLEESLAGDPIDVTPDTWAELDRIIDEHPNPRR